MLQNLILRRLAFYTTLCEELRALTTQQAYECRTYVLEHITIRDRYLDRWDYYRRLRLSSKHLPFYKKIQLYIQLCKED